MANADIVCRDIRITGKGRTRVARTCGARPGVSLASAERGKAIGDSRNGYRRNALYAVWSKGQRPDCFSVWFAQSDLQAGALKGIISEIISDKWGDPSSESRERQEGSECIGFSIPLGDDPLVPEWAKRYKFTYEGKLDFGIYVAAFDLGVLCADLSADRRGWLLLHI